MLKNFLFRTIARRLWLIAFIASVGIGMLTLVLLISEKNLILEERKSSVRQSVETAHGILTHFQALATKGDLSESDAKRNAIEAIKTLRYSGQEYFWINDMQPRMIMHPFKPELDGKDVSENKDPTGKHLFIEFTNTVKASGAGFVFYMWPKPGAQDPVPKMSYVKGFAPWGWVLGSGVYIDTIEAIFWNRFINMALAALTFTLFLGGFCLLIARSITRPLQQAVKVAQTVAAGDLTSQIQIRSNDEVGQLLHAMQDMESSLVKIVGQVRGGSAAIADAASQIAAGNMDLSIRCEQQASSLEETAASIEKLASTVKQNADNAQQANQLALSASAIATKGGAVVSNVVETMSSINASSRKIVDIISVIDGIAFQTNILALNAAVEAARAGEQGRGFAVVATEVRNLAQRSANAAKEIKALIGNSVEQVTLGSELVDQAGITMEEMVNSVQRVTDIMSAISVANLNQSSGIEQINQAMIVMDDATQQNAALVEEAAAAAHSLHEQADGLTQVVSVFKIHDQAIDTEHHHANVIQITKKSGIAIANTPDQTPPAHPGVRRLRA